MKPENFIYWLQGFFELAGEEQTLTPAQVQIIKDHLAEVLTKKTPNRSTIEETLYKDKPPHTIQKPFNPFEDGIYKKPATPNDWPPNDILIC